MRTVGSWLLCLLVLFGFGVANGGPFPEPEAVVAGFPIPSQQMAALKVIETVIIAKGQPQSAPTKALLGRYKAKMAELRKPNMTRSEFFLQLDDYMRRESFRRDVLHRYLPEYENASIAQFATDDRYTSPGQGPNTNLMVTLTALLMLAVPWVYLLRGERVGAPVPAGPPGPFQLPDALATVRLFRLRLHLSAEFGRIYDEKVETVVTKHSHLKRDRADRPGANIPSDYEHTFSSVTYHTLSVTTTDGRDVRRVFTDDEFPAAPGELMSAIWCGDRILYACNHSRSNFVSLHGGVGQTLRFRAGWEMWLATIGVAVAGGALILSAMDGEDAWRAFWAVVLVFGFFSGLYLVGLKMLVQALRRVPFRVIWRPRFKQFLEERTGLLQQGFRAN